MTKRVMVNVMRLTIELNVITILVIVVEKSGLVMESVMKETGSLHVTMMD